MEDEAVLHARVGATIRALREKSGLSMRELARRAGVSQPFLSQIERGASAPSMITTYRLAEALGEQPGALLPAPGEPVTVVRAGEGRAIPVANRPDAATGRALVMQPGTPLEVIEYVVAPGEYLEEWFALPGELAVYVVDGELEVEVEGRAPVVLGPRDLVSHSAALRHRWRVHGDAPVHLLLAIAHPPEGPARRPAARTAQLSDRERR
ncbi:helix-turn-helix domain-containing protein [Pseudonocardia oroxyli]|uniref:Transcriptional regulator, XRE family with cupin sensor n=1 Tax=Pseudonocardia oroxyli TaxID=366584 RepID=A0A1G7FW09_PSEOR|nr:XRE family transcriptional regulator [Pseudonocardia oroxyli]SDE80058.1 transcriptional regulator, XRE family with cupin sensor [Pseudonocardia oroxyli]